MDQLTSADAWKSRCVLVRCQTPLFAPGPVPHASLGGENIPCFIVWSGLCWRGSFLFPQTEGDLSRSWLIQNTSACPFSIFLCKHMLENKLPPPSLSEGVS
ncbi:hypothetical protein XENOCAPTIV_003539 [Xenoophorus captivus]|uniref:Uncharacterized protein n=1 Tax=Xenoophorus captivus TaxID=1517983 RepID=A0ABV0R386_9TELE